MKLTILTLLVSVFAFGCASGSVDNSTPEQVQACNDACNTQDFSCWEACFADNPKLTDKQAENSTSCTSKGCQCIRSCETTYKLCQSSCL